MTKPIVVVGAGQAAQSFIETFRLYDQETPIVVIGDEELAPYQRPPLSKKYLKGELGVERLMFKNIDYYSENLIDLRLGERVVSIDVEASNVTTVSGTVVAYHKLVIATGSTPRKLPVSVTGGLKGIYTMRSTTDADEVAKAVKGAKNALIIGGGYIGLEAAAVIRSFGLSVTLVEAAERILQRVACSQTSDFFRNLHGSNGVEILEKIGVKRLLGDGQVNGVELSDGRVLEVDLVIVGVGVNPGADFVKNTPIEINNGIAVNAFGETSVPGIYSAGDCASFPYRGKRLRIESVQNAIDQAKVVAKSIAGKSEEYRPVPWFWSDQYDVKLQIAGLSTGFDQIVERKGPREGSTSFWYFKEDEFLSVDALNFAPAFLVGKKLVESGRQVSPAQLADPDFDLRSLMR